MVEIVKGDISSNSLKHILTQAFVAIDIETTGLELATDTIALVQIHTEKHGTTIIQALTRYPMRLLTLLESTQVTKIFHYGKFDLSFFMRDFPLVQPKRIADTFIAANTLDPLKHRFSSHSLQYLVQSIFNYRIDKTHRVSDWTQDHLTEEQIQYARDDVRFLIPLLQHLENQITPTDLSYLAQRYRTIPQDAMLAVKG